MTHNTKVLTIEDDPALLRLVQYTLAEEGMDVATASNGRDGLRQFYALQPELVILDLMMPEMDGWETCRRIREMADVPIMMLTARGQDGDMVRGLDIGADDYMVKPFSPEVLVARAQALLGEVQTDRSLAGVSIESFDEAPAQPTYVSLIPHGDPAALITDLAKTLTAMHLLAETLAHPGRLRIALVHQHLIARVRDRRLADRLTSYREVDLPGL